MRYNSAFGEYIEGLIAHKHAIGIKYEAAAEMLKQFDDFCLQNYSGDQQLTEKIVTHWATRKMNESVGSLHLRVTCVNQLAQYMSKVGVGAYVYPQCLLPKIPQYVPYIFSDDELERLFSVIDACQYSVAAPVRHLVLPVLFRMLYFCGLRFSEALTLKNKNVDLNKGLLQIYSSKSDDERIVPMSNELSSICMNYANLMQQKNPSEYFFPSPQNTVYSQSAVRYSFMEFLWRANIAYGGKGKGPRIHDLRHTFAVHSLRKWILCGKSAAAYAPILKTYMGHASFRETSYYLRLVSEMYPHITSQLENSLGELVPTVDGGSEYEAD